MKWLVSSAESIFVTGQHVEVDAGLARVAVRRLARQGDNSGEARKVEEREIVVVSRLLGLIWKVSLFLDSDIIAAQPDKEAMISPI